MSASQPRAHALCQLRFLSKWWHTRSGARASFPGVKALPADPLPASRDLWPRLPPCRVHLSHISVATTETYMRSRVDDRACA
jgi:hypothetical protein